ncbi:MULTISPECIES: hypothetical protein [Yersinia]|uniref:Uncharacterized protein n=1 Tax=Yersinia enterocolitica TaxID=630 RepID=A0ABM9S8Y7_YEREN|nr:MULTISPECIES: hypothetical protein [Yersinia]MDA5526253.1 hypothetical protein [Yersinia mollaretii]MDR7873155.1 hypothetical protein [Yersinia mollaretii]PHZ32942.1 hypothetical protein CS537_03485 [Yersinia mollaretii]WQC76261.1 hypothetical protein U1Z61_07085 [Yersinia mollaretii]CNE50397.1 Uncharacterised protein [Yersinia enterocolitica]
MSTMTQIDYAKHAGVDRKTVSRWIKAGKYIVLDGDLVNVEESDKAVATLRDSKDPRTKNASKKRPVKVTAADLDDSTDETIKEIMLANGVEWSREEAAMIKENYLALLTRLEFEKEDGRLVDLSVAETVLFEAFRAQRDAWMNWPSRVAPLMAADLDVPADRMTEVLLEYVHKHISGLGEPEFNAEQT